jgi:NAD-dependent SIR2 family protein deacetylase
VERGDSEQPEAAPLRALAALLRGRRVVALTGAGCSTESGIPDYRGPVSSQRPRTPIQYRQFIDDPAARRRYWARSMVGWPRLAAARPNAGHRALASLERAGAVAGLITQNVDGLHRAAGSDRVVELHGALAEVRCLDCGAAEPRGAIQERLRALNPDWPALPDGSLAPAAATGGAASAPDGDAELDAAAVAGFQIAPCASCGGTLKPAVVFFGESVPRAVTDAAWSLFDEAEVLLVAGSSLAVFSGYRFVRRAAERGIPVAIMNQGPTRGDELAALRLDDRLGDALPQLAAALAPAPL